MLKKAFLSFLSLIKKINPVKTAAVFIAVTAAFSGVAFMVVTDAQGLQKEETRTASAVNLPGAGLSAQTLAQALSADDFGVDFISVSCVAQENTRCSLEVIETLTEAVEQIEDYAEIAAQSAAAYSEADEAYQEALSILDQAESSLEAAKAAQSYALSSMYVDEMDSLTLAAQAAAEEAQAQALAAKTAEEEAAAKAAEEAAAKAAAEEAAAKAAAEEAAAKAAAKEAAAEEAAQAAAEAAEEAVEESSDAAQIRQALVDYACSFVGVTPYKYGGTSLTGGVDCSGFTMAVYAQFGYTLSHSSSAQASAGRSVSVSEIKIGDLVCYSGHVGIYIGNGKVVHASGTNEGVTIGSLYMKSIRSIRRIIE